MEGCLGREGPSFARWPYVVLLEISALRYALSPVNMRMPRSPRDFSHDRKPRQHSLRSVKPSAQPLTSRYRPRSRRLSHDRDVLTESAPAALQVDAVGADVR